MLETINGVKTATKLTNTTNLEREIYRREGDDR